MQADRMVLGTVFGFAMIAAIAAPAGAQEHRGTFEQQMACPAAMASLEGKPICSPHPGMFLSPQNVSSFQKGVCLNVHRGPEIDGEQTLMADLLVTDPMLIDAILSGRLRECSVGYDCKYLQLDNGDYEQRDIRCNHLAVIPRARVGSVASITDSAPEEGDQVNLNEAITELKRINTLLERQQTVKAEDAVVNDELAALLNDEELASDFAAAVNEVGRRMRGRGDCRPGLRESADRRTQDAKTEVTAADDANNYARQMERELRK